MAEAPTRAGPTLLGTATTTIFTAGGAGSWAILRDITISNQTDAQIKVTVGIGTTNADASNKRILRDVMVQPGETVDFPAKMLPLSGSATTPDLVYALCDTANGATITLGLWTGP